MNKEQIYAIWAPQKSVWSRWVKPVLFAHLDFAVPDVSVTDLADNLDWAPPPAEKVAIVLDLPGAQGVLAGIALAMRGYQPIPLYNALPSPFSEPPLSPFTSGEMIAVNVLPIIAALKTGAEQLGKLSLPADAPPVFLLDSDRAGSGLRLQPHEFDNRSISFTTDFPSADILGFYGIQKIILIQSNRTEPRADLAHTLRRWQDAGFILARKRMDSPESAETFEVSKPSWYGAMFQRALTAVGFRGARGGGFGAWMPDSSSIG